SSRRRHTSFSRDWSSDVCSSDLLAQTAGLEALRDYRPEADGEIARRVLAAGAALLGKTNIPAALADWQANSPIYGRTNNPWNLRSEDRRVGTDVTPLICARHGTE